MSQQLIKNQSVVLVSQNQLAQTPSWRFLYIGAIVSIILVLIIVKQLKSKKKQRKIIALVGQRFAGKTQLFININEGKKFRTVPSIRNNKTNFKIERKIYQMIDYIGDNISKQQILQKLDEINTIIHVIDGSNEQYISDAAMFMYKVLVSKQYQKNSCNYIIFLNKNDLPSYIGRTKFQQKLEDQIQRVKQSRINQGQENQNEDDYIKLAKTRFKVPFKIVEGSAQSNIKDLQILFDNL